MSILTWITEKELKREINKRRRISLREQQEIFVTAVRNCEMLATSRVKMSVSEEHSEQEHKLATKSFVSTYDISSIKHVTRKFAVAKNDDKNKFITKRDARAKLCFAN